MAVTITEGYLIKVIDYRVFDQIVTFINQHGNKFVCFCAGTKKIMSKNARSLTIGNYNQWEFFYSNRETKMSRLLRSTVVRQSPWPNQKESFWLLQELTDKLIYPQKKNFVFYEQMLASSQQYDDQVAIMIILANYIKLTGINLYWKDCVYCHDKNIAGISFQSHGLICKQCQLKLHEDENYGLKFSQMLYYLFHEQYGKLSAYQNYFLLAITRLKKYINDNLGVYC